MVYTCTCMVGLISLDHVGLGQYNYNYILNKGFLSLHDVIANFILIPIASQKARKIWCFSQSLWRGSFEETC